MRICLSIFLSLSIYLSFIHSLHLQPLCLSYSLSVSQYFPFYFSDSPSLSLLTCLLPVCLSIIFALQLSIFFHLTDFHCPVCFSLLLISRSIYLCLSVHSCLHIIFPYFYFSFSRLFCNSTFVSLPPQKAVESYTQAQRRT